MSGHIVCEQQDSLGSYFYHNIILLLIEEEIRMTLYR